MKYLKSKDSLYILGMLGCVVFIFAPYLLKWPTKLIFPDSNLGTDFTREVLPLAKYIVEIYQDTGIIPLWRTYHLGGVPIVGHPVAPIFYPLNWLVLILPIPLALNLTIVLHLWWAGFGTYLCLRYSYNTSCRAAMLGGIIFALSPRWIAYSAGGHWSMIAAVAWWPWAWFGFSKYLESGKSYWILIFGLALSCQALTDLRMLALSILVIGLITCGYLIKTKLFGFRTTLLIWFYGLLILFGIAAVQVLPFLELLPYTNRLNMSISETSFGSLHPILLLSFLIPPNLEFPEFFIYPGIVSIILVLLVGTYKLTSREKLWIAVAIAALVLSLGIYTPIFKFLYHYLPGFRLLRVPARWWMYVLFAIALLAAWGFDKWVNQQTKQKRTVLFILLVGGLFYLVAVIISIIDGDLFPFNVHTTFFVFVLAGIIFLSAVPVRWRFGLVLGLILVDMFFTSQKLIRPVSESFLTQSDEYLLLINQSANKGTRVFSPYGDVDTMALVNNSLRAVDGYDSFQDDAYENFVNQAIGCDYTGYSVTVPAIQSSPLALSKCSNIIINTKLLELLNVEYIVLPSPIINKAIELMLVDQEHWVYYLQPRFERAFGVSKWIVVEPESCLSELELINPLQVAIVESPSNFESNGHKPEIISNYEYVNGEIFVVRMQSPGLLIRSESWAPGWKVSVNGHEGEVQRVDCTLQGVWLDSGEHEVKFEYSPQSYLYGKWISGFTFIVYLLLTLRVIIFKRRT